MTILNSILSILLLWFLSLSLSLSLSLFLSLSLSLSLFIILNSCPLFFAGQFKAQEKRVDYFERAKRKEELPLLKEAWEKYLVDSKRQWQEQQIARVEATKKEHAEALVRREKLLPMVSFKNTFMTSVMARRKATQDAELVTYTALKAKYDEAEKQQLEEQRRIAEEKEKELEEYRRHEEERREAEQRLQKEREERGKI